MHHTLWNRQSVLLKTVNNGNVFRERNNSRALFTCIQLSKTISYVSPDSLSSAVSPAKLPFPGGADSNTVLS